MDISFKCWWVWFRVLVDMGFIGIVFFISNMSIGVVVFKYYCVRRLWWMGYGLEWVKVRCVLYER